MAVKKKVETEFTSKGNLEKKFGLLDRAAARFGRSADKSFRRANRGASRFASTTKGVVAGLGISRGLALLSQGIGTVTSGFIAFDKAALGATVRFKDIGPEAADFNDQLKTIKKSARDMGATTEFTAAQAAEGLDFLARAGFTSTEAMGSLKSMIDLATSSGEDFAQVADMSSDLLGAFGLNAKDTGQKIANLNRLNDVLVKSANSANVTIETMFETMKTAAPIGRTLGIELEEVAALTAILGGAGIKGTEAGTALKNSFLKLAAATPATVKMLNDIGVVTDDGTGNMRKFTDILGDVGSATKEFGTLKVAKVLDTLFGKRAIAGASNLIEGIADVREFEESLKGAGKTSQLTAEIMRTSIDAKLKSLGSAATEAGFKILNAFEGDGKQGIDALTTSIRELDLSGVIIIFKGLNLVLGATLKIVNLIAKGFDITGKFLGTTAGKIVTTQLSTGATRGSLLEAFDTPQQQGQRARDQPAQRVGPNQKEAAAKAFPGFQGQLNIAGAPEGSTMETKAAPPGFSVAMLGPN